MSGDISYKIIGWDMTLVIQSYRMGHQIGYISYSYIGWHISGDIVLYKRLTTPFRAQFQVLCICCKNKIPVIFCISFDIQIFPVILKDLDFFKKSAV